MSALPYWAETALKYRINDPPGMQLNKRQVFLSYDHNGNVIEANDFSEFVPVGSVTPTYQLPQIKSHLQTFDRRLDKPVFETSSSRQLELPRQALWKSPPSKPSIDRPRKPVVRAHISPLPKAKKTPPPLPTSAIPAPPRLEDIPTLRELIDSKRSSSDISYAPITSAGSRPSPPKKPPPPPRFIRSSPGKPDAKRESSRISRLQRSPASSPGGSSASSIPKAPQLPPFGAVKKSPPRAPSIPEAPPLPSGPLKKSPPRAPSIAKAPPFGSLKKSPPQSTRPQWPPRSPRKESENGSYSRLYVPQSQHTGVNKPSEATYAKLRATLAQKTNQVMTPKESGISAMHKELLSRVRKISPVAEN